MANRRAVAENDTGSGRLEIPDTDTLNIGNIAPLAGALTLGGSPGTTNVQITGGHDLLMSGAGSDFIGSGGADIQLQGVGALQVSATGTHSFTGGNLDVDVTSDFSANIVLSGGADLTAGAGSALSGFDSIEGILSANLVDKTAPELITGQWVYQASNITNPKLIVKAAGGEAVNSLLFQVQTSTGANLFSVDVEGDVIVAGGETVAGTTIYTGDVTLGDGGNTIQLGSAASPAVGDTVHINTTGTADGQFTITTTNFNVDNAGNLGMGGDITLEGGGNILTTSNGDITLDANGTGGVNVADNLNAQSGLDVTGAALTANSGLTLTGVGITMTGLDIGTSGNRAGTGYFTTIDATNLVADGTNSNIWDINEDAVAGTPEDAGLILEGGDGANLQVWQHVNDSSAKLYTLRYKQNPTDPKDIAEAGYTNLAIYSSTQQVTFPGNVDAQSGLDVTGAALTVDANGIDSAGNIDLTNTLSFDAVGTIDTSGNNNLTIDVGTATLDVVAGTVDLQTSVTTLDVPDQTGFSIGGVALTTVLWTATAVDAVFGGPASNADAYHTHTSVAASNQLIIDGLTTAAMSQYQAGYVSANNTISPTDCSSATGSFITSTFAGVYDGAASKMVNHGKVEVQFDAALAPAPVAGDPAILSWVNSGQFRNRAPAVGSSHWLTRAGIVLDATNYGVTQRCVIVIQPDRPVQR